MASLDAGMVAILNDCCSYKVPALILNPERGLVFHSHFVAVSNDTVTLILANDIRRWLKTPRLFVSFSSNGKSCAFFAEVVEYKSNAAMDSSVLMLKLSSGIIGMESRMSFRVPIVGKNAPSVRVFNKEGLVFLPRPIDISFTGILIEFDKAEDPDFLLSEELRLGLRLNDCVLQLKAVVKRRDGHRYGLHFPEIVTRNGIRSPQALQEIISYLERISSGKGLFGQRMAASSGQ